MHLFQRNSVLEFAWWQLRKYLFLNKKYPYIPHCQNHGCWWPSYVRSHESTNFSRNIPASSASWLSISFLCWWNCRLRCISPSPFNWFIYIARVKHKYFKPSEKFENMTKIHELNTFRKSSTQIILFIAGLCSIVTKHISRSDDNFEAKQ